MNRLIVLAKDPQAVPAKTRLAVGIGRAAADDVAAALLEDAVTLADEVGQGGASVAIAYAPDEEPTRRRFAAMAPNVDLRPQSGGDLGVRMRRLAERTFDDGADRVVMIGTDCPTLTAETVAEAFDRLTKVDVVVAPAADGGYVLIGLSRPAWGVFEGVDWGGDRVLTQTAAACDAAAASLSLLATHTDLDRPEDLRPVLGILDAQRIAGQGGGNATRAVLAKLLSTPAFDPPPFEVDHFDDIPAVDCPCGTARRAWQDAVDFPATVHQTEIALDARPHLHRGQTECYVILECDGDAAMELDGRRVPVSPGSTVLIRPGCVHRAVGRMRVMIVCSPKFNPADEFE